jgi:hypothetical protein
MTFKKEWDKITKLSPRDKTLLLSQKFISNDNLKKLSEKEYKKTHRNCLDKQKVRDIINGKLKEHSEQGEIRKILQDIKLILGL